jgi:hypothetical protein
MHIKKERQANYNCLKKMEDLNKFFSKLIRNKSNQVMKPKYYEILVCMLILTKKTTILSIYHDCTYCFKASLSKLTWRQTLILLWAILFKFTITMTHHFNKEEAASSVNISLCCVLVLIYKCKWRERGIKWTLKLGV